MTRLGRWWPVCCAGGIALIIIGGRLLRQAFRPIRIGEMTG